MNDDDSVIFPPARVERRDLEISTVRPPTGIGGPIARWKYHFQTQTVYEQERLFNALSTLCEAQERAAKAKLKLEITLVSFEFLEEYKELERCRIRAEIEVMKERIIGEVIQSGVSLYKIREEAAKIMNPRPIESAKPPEPSKPKFDPVEGEIRDILRGGGKYTQMVHADKARRIRERGGEDKLTDDDRRELADAFQVAAERENSRGR